MIMDNRTVFCAGSTRACGYARNYLRSLGLSVSTEPTKDAGYLLLDAPSFQADGHLRGGGDVEHILKELPGDILICGGNLQHPGLSGYRTVDFLQDETYLCENAYITAECALDVALPYLTCTIRNCPVLILGWGRIGKCLGKLLKAMGADVTIGAQNPDQRAMIHALGYHSQDITDLPLRHYRLIYNTIPFQVLDKTQLSRCREDCVKIELASRDGMTGEDIIIARGLPGLHMPESSGRLIAETFLRLCYGR